MLKVMDFVRPLSGISLGEFRSAWTADRCSALGDARREGLRACVQNLCANPGGSFSPTGHRYNHDFAAVDEFWIQGTVEHAHSILPPISRGARLVDHEQSFRLYVREVVLGRQDHAGPAVKVLIFIAQKPGLTEERFFDHWTHVHGRLWRELRSARQFVPTLKSVQNYIPMDWNRSASAFGYAGITEGWHRSLETLAAPFNCVEHDEIIVPDANKFTDRAKVCDMLVDERVVFSDMNLP